MYYLLVSPLVEELEIFVSKLLRGGAEQRLMPQPHDKHPMDLRLLGPLSKGAIAPTNMAGNYFLFEM